MTSPVSSLIFAGLGLKLTHSGAIGGRIFPPALSLKIPELIFAALYSVLWKHYTDKIILKKII